MSLILHYTLHKQQYRVFHDLWTLLQDYILITNFCALITIYS